MNTIVRHGMALLLLALAATPARAQVASAPVASGPAVEIGLADFVDRVNRLADAVEHAERSEVEALTANLPVRFRIRAGDQDFDLLFGPIIRMITSPVADPAQWPERRAAIARHLRHVSAEAAGVTAATAGGGIDATVALAGILAREEFARAAPTDWFTRLGARLRAWLLALWERLGGRRLDTPRLARALVWLSTVAAIAGLLYWGYRRARRRIDASRPAPAAELPAPARERALQALAAMRAGRASEAVRLAYAAAVTHFAELGVWRIDDTRTAREYVSLLSQSESRGAAFRDIAGQLEHVAYANRAATAEDLARVMHHLETLGCLRPQERAI